MGQTTHETIYTGRGPRRRRSRAWRGASRRMAPGSWLTHDSSAIHNIGVRVHDGVRSQGVLDVPTFPVGGKAVLQVPVYSLAQAVCP